MASFSIASAVTEVKSVAELADIQSGKLVLFFWAAWHEPSQPGGQMDSVIAQLAADAANASLRFAKVEAALGGDLSGSSIQELEGLWQQAKAELRSEQGDGA